MKILKRIGLILSKILISIIILLAIAYGLLQLPYSQKKITNFISKKISASIDLQVSISHISVSLWNNVIFSDISITNKENNKIASIPKLSASISEYNGDSLSVTFSNISIFEGDIVIQKNKQGVLNIDGLLKKLQSPSKGKSLQINIEAIDIFDSQLEYSDLTQKQNQDFGINYNNLKVKKLNFHCSNFTQKNSSYSFSLNKVSFVEKSGFTLQYFKTDAIITDSSINCKDLMIFTPNSKIYANSLVFDFTNFDAFNDFTSKVRFNSDFAFSTLDLKDISYFSPDIKNNPYSFSLSGKILGTVSNIRGKNISLGYGSGSRFIGNIEISGLPNFKESFIHITAKTFETNTYDISHSRIPPFTETHFVTIPNFFKNIEYISYTGNFTGFIYDFVAYGTLHSNAGTIYSDILISQTSNKSLFNYSGKLTFDNFDLHTIPLQTSIWGIMNSTVSINGIYSEKSILTASVKGTIKSIQIQEYNYTNIDVDGELSNQKFNGNLSINDPNIQMKFNGLFDFSTETPIFNFNANIDYANIYNLGLYKNDSIASISFTTQVDFIGLKLDNLKGNIRIPTFSYTGKNGTYKTNDVHINIDNINQTRNVSFSSDLLDLTINGKGNYKELPTYLYDFIQSHISVLPKYNFRTSKTFAPNFNISLRIKKIDSLLHVLYPQIHISQGSYLNTVYTEESNLLLIQAKIPDLKINEIHIQNITVSSEGNSTSLNTFITFDYDIFKDIQSLWNVKKDSIFISTHWNNNDSIKYSGSLLCNGKFFASNNAYFPGISMKIAPSNIYIADSLWNIYASEIKIDSTSISIPYASFGKNSQLIKLNGIISENPSDKLKAEFFNYNVENFNYLIGNKLVNLEGVLQGFIEIQDFYKDQLIVANINSPMFSFNGHKIGKLTAISQWIPLQKAIAMSIILQQGNVNILKAVGTYAPTSKKIDYEISVKDLKLTNFKEIFEPTLHNFTGYIDGSISATGELTNPQFGGELEIKRGKFIVDYTKTLYNFKGKLHSQGSKFIFYDMPISDSLSNYGLASGYFDLKNIKNPKYSLHVETDKLMVLHTKETDNDMFYGNAFFQGNVTIEGNLNHTSITAIGKTLDNTEFNIPLSYSELTSNKDFLKFSDTLSNKKNKTQTTSSFQETEVSINLLVTPATLAQIIFDKKVGDIIKVKGNGTIEMKMNKQGVFTMYGDYLITEGDYLFTLKNLINKKFIIQHGGTIKWNGDPLGAQIDVLAKYELKAAPKPIMDPNSTVNYSRRVPITCDIHLVDNLTNPEITYDISVPNVPQVQETINTFSSDEKNMQFLSLLLMNTFMSRFETQNLNASASYEVLSNQINNLLSQANLPVDVGFNYRPGDIYSANEVELALSTQLLNNRILINVNGYSDIGNTPTEQTSTQTNEFAGDVNVEIKLNEEGTFKVKGFSRSNNDPLAENQGNTQGVSLFFTREFNTLRELLRRK